MIPKISIIIPCYNTEKYLEHCLQCIQKQTLKDIEIICVDDNSTDNTLKILKNIAKKDKRIRIIAKDTNEGAGKARNVALDIAVGDYVVFLDPDDYYPEESTLEKLYLAVSQHNVNIAGGNLIKIDPDNNKSIEKKFTTPGLYIYKDNPFSYGYTLFIYNRKFLIKNKLYFPDYRRFQDPPFLVNTMILAKKFYAITDAVYIYRVSYKKIEWTESKILDVLNGISDILLLSKENNIPKLYIEQLNILWHEIAYVYKQQTSFNNINNKLVDIFKNIDTYFLTNYLDKKFKYQKYYCNIIKRDPESYKKWKNYIKWPSFINRIFYKERYRNGHREIYFLGIKIFSYDKK